MTTPYYLREDLAQEAQIAAEQAYLTYDPTKSAMRRDQYVRVKAKQAKIDFLRRWFGRNSDRPKFVDIEDVRRSTRPAPLPEPRLLREVDALPAPERDVIVLFYWLGCTHAEIADKLHWPKPARVSTVMASAMNQLKEKLT